jgi:hypothetical protein
MQRKNLRSGRSDLAQEAAARALLHRSRLLHGRSGLVGISGGRVRLRLLGSRRGPGRGRGRAGGSATRRSGSGTALLARHFGVGCVYERECDGVRGNLLEEGGGIE